MDRSANSVAYPSAGASIAVASIPRAGVFLLRVLLRLHRMLVSPLLGPACRFEPTCSRFAEQAIERHGCLGGIALAAARLIRCHPWGGPGGFDPVP